MNYLLNKGEKVTILHPKVKGHSDIYTFHYSEGIIPLIQYHSCTDKFKIQPMKRHYKKPYINYIGFDADEKHRVRVSEEKGIEYQYPLIEWGLHRRDCEKIVADAHVENKPIKSGCYFCPFQGKENWWDLYRKHPGLFWKAVQLEEHSRMRYFEKRPLRAFIPPPSTFEFIDMRCERCVFGLP
jgi:hypothetical protein